MQLKTAALPTKLWWYKTKNLVRLTWLRMVLENHEPWKPLTSMLTFTVEPGSKTMNLGSIGSCIWVLRSIWYNASTTKKCAFYIDDSKTVVKDRLRKSNSDIFIINRKKTTLFPQSRLWSACDGKSCKFFINIQKRSSPEDRLCMVSDFMHVIVFSRDYAAVWIQSVQT